MVDIGKKTPGLALEANETQSAAILIKISTNRPQNYTRYLDIVCPLVTFIFIEGCYNCQEGAVITVSSKSTCLPGPALLTVVDPSISIRSNSIDCPSIAVNQTISFYTNQSSPDFFLNVIGNGGQSSVHVFGELTNLNDIHSINHTTGISTGITNDSAWTTFSNFWKHVLFNNWWRGILSGIATLLLAILVFYFMYQIFKMTTTYVSKKKTS